MPTSPTLLRFSNHQHNPLSIQISRVRQSSPTIAIVMLPFITCNSRKVLLILKPVQKRTGQHVLKRLIRLKRNVIQIWLSFWLCVPDCYMPPCVLQVSSDSRRVIQLHVSCTGGNWCRPGRAFRSYLFGIVRQVEHQTTDLMTVKILRRTAFQIILIWYGMCSAKKVIHSLASDSLLTNW